MVANLRRIDINTFINACRDYQADVYGYYIDNIDCLLHGLCNGHKVAISDWQLGHVEIDDVLIDLRCGIGVGNQYYEDPIVYILTLLIFQGQYDTRLT